MYIDKSKISTELEKAEISVSYYEHRNQLTLIVAKENLLKLMNLLKTSPELDFDMCLDVTAIDWMKKNDRFEVVYNLYSNNYKYYLRVKTPVNEHDCKCPSVTSIWASANWYERETYDMYGIIFENHPFLRRFYMPEDFKDPVTEEPIYPLRKDVPLMGIPDALPLPPYPEKFGDLN
jgi:NADH-quinone oxidoreductase subunit C